MLVGQFELLLVKQQEYDAYQGYLEAVRDYWLARVELARTVGAPLPSAAQAGDTSLDAETLIQPNDSGMQMDGMKGMDHSRHNMKGMGNTVTSPPKAPGGHEGHAMPEHGAPRKSKSDPADDAANEPSHQHH
jgi:outer membrane protein, heavy metal efflux system